MPKNQNIKFTFNLFCGHFFYLNHLPSVIILIKAVMIIRMDRIFILFIANFKYFQEINRKMYVSYSWDVNLIFISKLYLNVFNADFCN